MLLRRVAKDVTLRCFHGINAMILMPQIFDVTANENARYKRNELEFYIYADKNLISLFCVLGLSTPYHNVKFNIKINLHHHWDNYLTIANIFFKNNNWEKI